MTDAEIQAYIVEQINARLTKVRIPELPENTDGLSEEDRLPIWIKEANKTRWESLGDLATFFALGGDGTTTPGDSAAKGQYTFDVTAAQAGSDTISLPQFAGKNAAMAVDGRVWLDTEYDFLNAGGVKSNISGFVFQEGMRVTLTFAEPIAGGTSPTTTGGFIKGTRIIESTTTLAADDARKLIQLRAGDTLAPLTLPSVASLTDNDFLIVEANISNQKQQKVQTQGGQLIYLGSTSKTALYLAPGEVLWLFRKSDGWYTLDNFFKLYEEVGHPVARYKVGANELILKGQQVAKADYPRLYEQAQGFGGGFVAKATYDSDPLKYRGCYVEISSTHFQLPNLMNMALRGLESESGADSNRSHNAAGGYQADTVGSHQHLYNDRYWNESAGSVASATVKESAPAGYNAGAGSGDTDTDNNTFLYYQATTLAAGSEETTMKNIGIYWVTKI